MTMTPFDHQPDPELGRMLREQLTGRAPEAFLERLRVAVAGADPGNQWDVLAGWARPRVMAVAVAAGFLLWLGAWVSSGTSSEEPGVTMASIPAQTVVSSQSPAVDEIMSALRERP